jgi:hypothetical protein
VLTVAGPGRISPPNATAGLKSLLIKDIFFRVDSQNIACARFIVLAFKLKPTMLRHCTQEQLNG